MKKISRLALKTKEGLCTTTDKTEYDPVLKILISKADRAQILTKNLVDNTKAIVGRPNTGQDRNVLEDLGRSMDEFGRKVEMVTSEYGMRLILVGHTEERMGRVEREYVQSVYTYYIDPMEVSLKLDTKSLEKEKSELENRRLDLDNCKNKRRKANTNEKILAANQSVKLAESEFDRQMKMLHAMLDRTPKTQQQHLCCLEDLVREQASYYQKCHEIIRELYDELNNKKTVIILKTT